MDNFGDIVNYNGTLYESTTNGNMVVPSADERYWKKYKENE